MGTAAGQVSLRQERRQRVPRGMLGELGIVVGWAQELVSGHLGEKVVTRANCTSGKLEVSLCWTGPSTVLQQSEC